MKYFVGCAGWQIGREHRESFGTGDSVLVRYATRFNAVEINSTFRSIHKPSTFTRWRESVPDNFRFSVKVPKEVTHDRRLIDCGPQIGLFLRSVMELGEKCGPVLVQLPPSFQFDHKVVNEFFARIRDRFEGAVVCEPPHHTWASDQAVELLIQYRVARAARRLLTLFLSRKN